MAEPVESTSPPDRPAQVVRLLRWPLTAATLAIPLSVLVRIIGDKSQTTIRIDGLIVASVVAALLSVLLALLRIRSSRHMLVATRKRMQELEAQLQRVAPDEVGEWAHRIDPAGRELLWRALLADANEPDVVMGQKSRRASVEESVAEFKARLERLESNLPPGSRDSRDHTIQDAVLELRVKNLERDVQRLQASSLEKWDVAVIVLAVLAALGTITGGIFAALAYLKP